MDSLGTIHSGWWTLMDDSSHQLYALRAAMSRCLGTSVSARDRERLDARKLSARMDPPELFSILIRPKVDGKSHG
jgi:hypothetical protein